MKMKMPMHQLVAGMAKRRTRTAERLAKNVRKRKKQKKRQSPLQPKVPEKSKLL